MRTIRPRQFWNRGRVVWTILFVAATVPAWGDWRAWVLRKPDELPGKPAVLATLSEAEEQAIQQDVASAWQDLKDVLTEYHPEALLHLRPGLPEEDVNALERLLGFRFPPHYRASLLLHDGFDPKARLIWWMPKPVAFSSRVHYIKQTHPRNYLGLTWHPTFHRAGWHPRYWKITGRGYSSATHDVGPGHTVNLETGQVLWLDHRDSFPVLVMGQMFFSHRSVNMAEHLRRCAELMVPKSERSAWKDARR